tara:strand:- start:1404 stop:1958 length:555 start_codon:yes stop_codon:yes gene_type:complete
MNKITYGDNKITLNKLENYVAIDIYFAGNYYIDIDCPQNHFAGLSGSKTRCIITSFIKNSFIDKDLVIANYEGDLIITKAFAYNSQSQKIKIEIEKLDLLNKFSNIESNFNSTDIIFNNIQKYSEFYRKRDGKVSNLSSEFIVENQRNKYLGSKASEKYREEIKETKEVSTYNEEQDIETSNLY